MGGASVCGAYAQKSEAPKIQAPKTTTAKAPAAKAPSSKKQPAKPAPKPEITAERLDEVAAEQQISQSVVDIAGWVIASADNRGLPFAVVDKQAAQILIFGGDGKLRGMAPVLLGSAVGDDSAEGVGDRELKDIPKDDRTTPAGRYVAGYGPAAGGERVLWVDYNTSVSIHPMPTTSVARKEKRKERLASSTVDDNRITHGCINVSSAFYTKVVKSVFGKKGGIFYVLPEVETLQAAFPSFGAAMMQVADSDDGPGLSGR